MKPEEVPIAWSIKGALAACDYADKTMMAVNRADLQACVDPIIARVHPLIAVAERERIARLVASYYVRDDSDEDRLVLKILEAIKNLS